MEGTAAQAAVEAFKVSGVDTIFGLMGSSTLDLYDALYDTPEIRYVGVRDERAGTHMADAYGRITGRPAVMIAGQSGPGATNLVTGLGQAALAYSPMLVIAGLPMSNHIGKDSFQEIDQETLFRPVAKKVLTVPSGQRIPEFIQDGLRVANSGRRGPVVLNIARNLFADRVKVDLSPPRHNTIYAGHLSPQEMSRVMDVLLSAKAPVVIAGAGIKWARGHAEVMRLAETLHIPIVASSGHGDVVPNDHPLYFGYAGPAPYGNPIARSIVQQADLIIALGTRLGFNTTLYGHEVVARGTKIIQVDLDAGAIGKYYPVEIGIVGDASSFAACLFETFQSRKSSVPAWQSRLPGLVAQRTQLWEERDRQAEQITVPLRPEPVFAALRHLMPRNTIIAVDSGTLCRQAADMLTYYEPPALLTPLDFGLVGFGYAAGLGAKVATPDRPVVSISGDGGFGMTMIELCTAVQSKINTVALVLDNDCWGAERAYQRDFYGGRFIGDSILNPRFDLVAQSSGGDGCYVTKADEIKPALERAFGADVPFVIHMKVDAAAAVSSRKDALKHRIKQ
jgi:acetolactate synthase I/II/III large subunit